MFRVVVFDFDGTLVDSNGIKEAALHATVAGLFGGPAALNAARRFGGDRYRLFAEVARQLDPDGDPVAIARRGYTLATEYGRRCARGIAAAAERRGSKAALAALKRRRLRLYVNSSTPLSDLKRLLRTRGIARYFDGVNGSPRQKTDNLRAIMRAEGVSPRQTIVIGDGEDDLTSARKLGTWFVEVSAERRIHERVQHRIKDLTLLLALLDRIAARPTRRRGNGAVPSQ